MTLSPHVFQSIIKRYAAQYHHSSSFDGLLSFPPSLFVFVEYTNPLAPTCDQRTRISNVSLLQAHGDYRFIAFFRSTGIVTSITTSIIKSSGGMIQNRDHIVDILSARQLACAAEEVTMGLKRALRMANEFLSRDDGLCGLHAVVLQVQKCIHPARNTKCYPQIFHSLRLAFCLLD